jgi:hypothetical protein
LNSNTPSAVVLIDFDSDKSGELMLTCTRRTGRPESAATTRPLTDAVPLAIGLSRD